MGEISVDGQHLERLLKDRTGTYGASYQRAFAELVETHQGQPVAEILPLLRQAADRALLGFADADLCEQAAAISAGERYVLRVTVTR